MFGRMFYTLIHKSCVVFINSSGGNQRKRERQRERNMSETLTCISFRTKKRVSIWSNVVTHTYIYTCMHMCRLHCPLKAHPEKKDPVSIFYEDYLFCCYSTLRHSIYNDFSVYGD